MILALAILLAPRVNPSEGEPALDSDRLRSRPPGPALVLTSTPRGVRFERAARLLPQRAWLR